MDLSTIISEADTRMPNAFDNAQKVDWLNEINQEFFDVVKIPKIIRFDAVTGGDSYILDSFVRSKNVDQVRVGSTGYASLQYEPVPAGRNFWTLDDDTHELIISPAPLADETGYVRYRKIATTTFLVGTLTAVPDAPSEYHWIYILGLCERIAMAMDDIPKSNNFGAQYRNNLLVAQQNFQRG